MEIRAQIALSLIFVGIFWLVLYLGAQLFELVKIDFLTKLLEHRWISFPLTTLSFAGALHVTDVRAGLIRGTRMLVLTLLSWLLPVLVLLVAAFLAVLPFTGLQPLWDTRYAASLLLTSALILLLLTNAAYQDGVRKNPLILSAAGSLAAFLMMALVGLAAYAIMLRVEQYGWTTHRILAAGSALVLGWYAVSYAVSAVLPGPWLRRIERANFFAALAVVAVIFLLLSPVGSPARISVESQMARLRSGAISLTKFDFRYLRFEGGRYGREALVAMRDHPSGPDAADMKARADYALNSTNRFGIPSEEPEFRPGSNITVHPEGRTLPPELLSKYWGTERYSLPQCIWRDEQCDALIVDADGDGNDDVIMFDNVRHVLLTRDASGTWIIAADLPFPFTCPGVREDMLKGRFTLVAPEVPRWRDIEAGGRRLHIEPRMSAQPCAR